MSNFYEKMKEVGNIKKDNVMNSTRSTMVSLCKEFHQYGWMTGTGGAISMRHGEIILITPSGALKENVKEDDIFQVTLEGEIIKNPDDSTLRFSSCLPNFKHIYTLRYYFIWKYYFFFLLIIILQTIHHCHLPHTQPPGSPGLPACQWQPPEHQALADGERYEGPWLG